MKKREKKIEAVIFDMDGVIIDTEPLNDQHKRTYFGNQGIKFPDDYFEQLQGTDSRTYYAKIIQDFNLPHDLNELIVDARKNYIQFLKSKKDLQPVSGVKEILTKLRKNNYKVALASSANPARVTLLLTICKLEEYFDVITNVDQVKQGKPAPDIYLKTAKLLKIAPETCLVIEDAENGVKSAKAAGMKVFGYAGLVHNKQNLSQADKIIHSFSEISNAITQSV